MTRSLPLIPDADLSRSPSSSIDDEPGFGALRTEKGHLPLAAMDIRGRIDGLLARVVVRQTFVNAHDEPLEAAYIFPLPDRAAVTQFRMTVAGREIDGVLEERGQARAHYEEAIARGQRAAIAEEDRPGVFNLRVGNLMPGERATIELTLCGVLPYADGEVTFRFPLVVAPRYVPGRPLPGPSVGDGTAVDTDAVPDASRISPPVLLPGFPNPVRLSLEMELHDGAAGLGEIHSSLHVIHEDARDGYRRIRVQPGERLDRDFILRFRLGGDGIQSTLTLHPDRDDPGQGTFALTVVPPTGAAVAKVNPRDVVFVLDRSGSMEGWKIVAARRALARMIDTLGEADRFNLVVFDSTAESPGNLPDGLTPATDRARFRAVEYLATLEARGGTEMAEPLDRAVKRLTASTGEDRDRVLVLVTDGQIANEDQVLNLLGTRLKHIRVFTIGIDRAVNEGFLRRLAESGGGSFELVESEDRLDGVMSSIHRRIGTPLLTSLSLTAEGLSIEPAEIVPRRLPDLFAGSPVLILGRYRGRAGGAIAIRGTDSKKAVYDESLPGCVRDNPAIAAAWARGQIRQLEDRYAAVAGDRPALEKAIVGLSMQFRVLCRFTAYVAVDRSQIVNQGGSVHRITQPVESPSGWASPVLALPAMRPRDCTKERNPAPGCGSPRSTGSPDNSLEDDFGGGARAGASRRSKRRPESSPPPPSRPAPSRVRRAESPVPPPPAANEMIDALCSKMPPLSPQAPTLEEQLAAGRRRAPRRAADIVAQIAEALQILHEQDLIHGDLSPSQVPMRDEDHAAVSPIPERWIHLANRPSKHALPVGPYTAPERLGGATDPLHPQVDVYSLGVILYQLLTGLSPFPESHATDTERAILQGTAPPPRRIVPSIPAELEAICLKAMAKDPAARYATAGDLAAALRGFLKPRRKAFWR
jgi:Ca-activated chloride channel family protein